MLHALLYASISTGPLEGDLSKSKIILGGQEGNDLPGESRGIGGLEKSNGLLKCLFGYALLIVLSHLVQVFSESFVRFFYVTPGVARLLCPFPHFLPKLIRNAPVRSFDVMFFGSGDGIAILVHGEAETDILPEGTHVTFADAVVDELGDLVQGCPGYTMLSNVHVPRLDGLPDLPW